MGSELTILDSEICSSPKLGCFKDQQVKHVKYNNQSVKQDDETIPFFFFLLPLPKMLKGRRWCQSCCHEDTGDQEGGKSPVQEKAQEILALNEMSSPKETSPTLQSGPATFGYSSKGLLCKRLKVPPAINQFTQVLDCKTTNQLLKLTHEYRPEVKQEKQQRLLARAEKTAASQGDVPTKRHLFLEQG